MQRPGCGVRVRSRDSVLLLDPPTGSVDWLWEFPALGAMSFMFLGLAASPSKRSSRPSKGQTLVAIAVACAGLLLLPPWLAARRVDRASSIWRADPSLAYRLLRQAARLNPVSEQPLVVQGTIAAERRQSAADGGKLPSRDRA